MKQTVWALACLIAGAGALSAPSRSAFAQDKQEERDKKIEELKRGFDHSMKALQKKFEIERARLEKHYKSALEKFKGGEEKRDEPRNVESLLKKILERVERLEERLEKELPRLRQLPKEFKFKFDPEQFKGFNPEQFKDFRKFEEFRKFMPPKFEGRDWKKFMERMRENFKDGWKGGKKFLEEFEEDFEGKKGKKDKGDDF